MKDIKSNSLVIGLIQLTILLLFAVTGCKRQNQYDSVLIGIAKTVSDNPEQALERLDNINPNMLSDRDRHYYDFLIIKAKDKAYITHESDSLILDLLKYYESGSDAQIYNEVYITQGVFILILGTIPQQWNIIKKPWII